MKWADILPGPPTSITTAARLSLSPRIAKRMRIVRGQGEVSTARRPKSFPRNRTPEPRRGPFDRSEPPHPGTDRHAGNGKPGDLRPLLEKPNDLPGVNAHALLRLVLGEWFPSSDNSRLVLVRSCVLPNLESDSVSRPGPYAAPPAQSQRGFPEGSQLPRTPASSLGGRPTRGN